MLFLVTRVVRVHLVIASNSTIGEMVYLIFPWTTTYFPLPYQASQHPTTTTTNNNNYAIKSRLNILLLLVSIYDKRVSIQAAD
jgi:hypothetical protein